ncbi:phage head completion protein [Lactobacillus crispatus]|uniref:phage head completion protein n=1 Tax=Lactobacillus crispatus TaxID=47770 RepID=UPI00105D2BFA|nr:hypothetical protein [Lactobacillus crispatus]TDN08683.1 hypothetical protein CEE83_12725 [Lactobacillus crispatus]DAS58383.1 MAG TPA: head closure knob [Caudoviricetes sp.]
MALNKFTGRSFSRSIVFGTSVKTRDENDGSEKMTFKRLLGPFHCAPYIRTMHQNFELMGTKYSNTRQVSVNHQWVGSKLTRKMKFALLDGEIYQIVDNGSDQTDNPNGVDILSLQLAEDIEMPEGVSEDG